MQIAGMDGRRVVGSFRRAEDSTESGWGGVAWLGFFFWWGGELGLRIFLLQASGGRLCSVCSLSPLARGYCSEFVALMETTALRVNTLAGLLVEWFPSAFIYLHLASNVHLVIRSASRTLNRRQAQLSRDSNFEVQYKSGEGCLGSSRLLPDCCGFALT